jgi:hypothetical protein
VTVFVDEQRASEARALSQLMTDVLTAIENTYLSAGVSLPDRRYWLMGEPVVDCEQLTVGFIQAYIGPPGDEASTPQNCDAVKTAVLQVQVWRCVPVAGPKGKQRRSRSTRTYCSTPLGRWRCGIPWADRAWASSRRSRRFPPRAAMRGSRST